MPSAFIHYFFGIVMADLFGYSPKERLLAASISVLPDLDFITIFFLKWVFRISKNHPLIGRAIIHRGMTHTFLFAISASLLLLLLGSMKGASFFFFSLLFHIGFDYLSIWGVNPLFPFVRKSLGANLFSIYDIPATLMLFFTSIASFFSQTYFVMLLLLCIVYLIARILLKSYIGKKTGASSVLATSSAQYAYAKVSGDDYEVGKFDILSWENQRVIVPSNRHNPELEGLLPTIGGMASEFLSFPVFVKEGKGTRVFDARSVLFEYQTPFSMAFFLEDGRTFIEMNHGKVEIPEAWVGY